MNAFKFGKGGERKKAATITCCWRNSGNRSVQIVDTAII